MRVLVLVDPAVHDHHHIRLKTLYLVSRHLLRCIWQKEMMMRSPTTTSEESHHHYSKAHLPGSDNEPLVSI